MYPLFFKAKTSAIARINLADPVMKDAIMGLKYLPAGSILSDLNSKLSTE